MTSAFGSLSSFLFHEASTAPAESGVYAWYYRYSITRADIERLKASLESSPKEEHHSLVRSFLLKTLFEPLSETPYNVRVSGPLKPTYQGTVPHCAPISSQLIEQLAADPDQFFVLSALLARSVPMFASPIYIGSAVSLRTRLRTHVRLIQRYVEGSLSQPPTNSELDDIQRADHSFAFEVVCQRHLDPQQLQVTVMPTRLLSRSTVYSIENVLNRLNFPLCGRN